MKKIIFFLIIFCSVSFAEEFIPSLEVGDNWTVRREISGLDNLESNNSKIQYWKYEVISNFEINKKEYLVIFATSKEVTGNVKIVVIKDKFLIKEINVKYKDKVTVVNMEEENAPVIDINILGRLYDLPAFPLIDPNLASKNVFTLPNGKKRVRKNFRRHYSSRGEVGSSELIWQETDNILRKDIKTYSKKTEDYINKITDDGYLIYIKGERKKVKQIWVESVPWWIYNESVHEKDYLVNYHSGSMK